MYKPEVWEAIKNNAVTALPQKEDTQTASQDSQNASVGGSSTTPGTVPAATPTTSTPEPTTNGSTSTPEQTSTNGDTTTEKKPQPPIVGVNSGNGVTLPQKKHIDYAIEFVLFLLKLLHLS
jgi:hypothetical protein